MRAAAGARIVGIVNVILLTFVAVAHLGAGVNGTWARTACAERLESDLVSAADVVLEGSVVEWTVPDAFLGANGAVPVQIHLKIEATYKGDGALAELFFIDEASLIRSAEGDAWVAAASGCGIFAQDPTGRYLVLGLEDRDGELFAYQPFLLFSGDAPVGDAYESAVRSLPAPKQDVIGGTEVQPPDSRNVPAMLGGLGVMSLAIAVLLLTLPRRSTGAGGD